MTSRSTAPFPDDIQTRIGELMTAHRELPTPPQVGQIMGIRRDPR